VNRRLPEEQMRQGMDRIRENLPLAYREHLDSCDGCRRFTLTLRYAETPGALRVDPPADLAAKAAHAARRPPEAAEPQAAKPEIAEERQPARRILQIPRWAHLAAAALLLVAATVGITLHYAGGDSGDTMVVHLHLKAPDANKVTVVGDWNDWQPQANPLKDHDNDGVWETKIRIPKEGEYQYQFLINGKKWIPDPNAPMQVEDGFGGTNSVLDI